MVTNFFGKVASDKPVASCIHIVKNRRHEPVIWMAAAVNQDEIRILN